MNKLEKLPKNLTQSEFLDYLSLILKILKKLQDDNKKLVATTESELKKLLSEVEFKKGDTGEKGERGDKGEPGKDGVDGKDGKNGRDGKDGQNGKDGKDAVVNEKSIALNASKIALDELKPLIPSIDEIEQDLPRLGAAIRDGLELLPEGEKLRIDAIENLRKELDDLERRIVSTSGKTMYVPAGSGAAGRQVFLYDLSSQLNGVTKTFNLPSFSRIVGVFSNNIPGPAFRPTIDFTSDSGAHTITFTSEVDETTTLSQGQSLLVQYAI